MRGHHSNEEYGILIWVSIAWGIPTQGNYMGRGSPQKVRPALFVRAENSLSQCHQKEENELGIINPEVLGPQTPKTLLNKRLSYPRTGLANFNKSTHTFLPVEGFLKLTINGRRKTRETTSNNNFFF